MKIVSKKVRDAARGQQCTLQIVGACFSGSETVVLAHLPDESNGMGGKSDDLSACFACIHCHQVIDGQAPWPEGEREYRDWYMRRAQTRTLRRLFELDILSIKGA